MWMSKLEFSKFRTFGDFRGFTGKVENLHAHVNRNLQHANPNLHVL